MLDRPDGGGGKPSVLVIVDWVPRIVVPVAHLIQECNIRDRWNAQLPEERFQANAALVAMVNQPYFDDFRYSAGGNRTSEQG